MATSNIDDKDCSPEENQVCSVEDLSSKTQQFLDSDEISLITDPKLKKEKQKLNELLESYKRLIDKLDSKFENVDVKADHERKLHRIPEIYAILHPELYKNPREEEKKRLISKFSKRQFSAIDKIAPPLYRTPPANLNDTREAEKERLIKIISSCPARFHNLSEIAVPSNKGRRSHDHCLARDIFLNQREAEKERLSKILATSGTYYRKHLDTNHRSSGKRSEVGISNSVTKHPKGLSCQGIKRSIPSPYNSPKEEIANLGAGKARDMVRVGEYSPLTSKERSRTLFGYGEHEERRSQLLAERRKEYKHYLSNNLRDSPAKVDKALSTDNDVIEETDRERRRSRSHSVSTQTEDLPADVIDGVKEVSMPATSSKHNAYELETSPRQVYYLSPREKLMSDLHGVSHCFPGASPSANKSIDSQDIKLRQAAYARALQEQIEEKRKLEEERKKKERQEDDLIEQRIRLQQEKVKSDITNEQKKKQDWIAQRQSQEEIMRNKMVEMKFEAQELIKQQNRKKRESGNVSELRAAPVSVPHTTSSEPSRNRELLKPQTTLSEPSNGRDLGENAARQARKPEQRFNAVERAPLLEADKQNILSNYIVSGQPVFSLPKTTKPKTVMKPTAEDVELRIREREKAEELLRVPLDFRIDRPQNPSKPVNSNTNGRSPSPPIPALRTRDIINNNTKVLDDKWKVPGHGRELNRTQTSQNHENILTQLGAFRRQLQQEHLKLEARLQKEASPT